MFALSYGTYKFILDTFKQVFIKNIDLSKIPYFYSPAHPATNMTCQFNVLHTIEA